MAQNFRHVLLVVLIFCMALTACADDTAEPMIRDLGATDTPPTGIYPPWVHGLF